MPPLNNPRWEKFVQSLLEGQSAVEAYQAAGYARDDGNATRLRANRKIQQRLAELQTEVAKETKITVEGLLSELEAARQKATDLEQLSAAVRAIEAKAKISGLLVQKVEVSAPDVFDQAASVEEAFVDALLSSHLNWYHQVHDGDREELVALVTKQFAEIDERIEAIKARPVIKSPQQQTIALVVNDKGR